MGIVARLLRSRKMAEKRQGRRQSLAGAIPRPRSCLAGRIGSRQVWASGTTFEVTERLLLEDNDGTLAAMEQLKNLGVGISLDDFGTGYSSLNYLRKFPFQKIKIDQSFIAGLGEERDAQAIIGAVAGLGARLNKVVVAEGIETEEQMKQVRTHGCHEGQGHLFGEPMTAEAIRTQLETSTTVAQLVA
jgi:EAL domain-containing protein (putative c-di-GMP-specific phosphodiesterase class I)